MNKLSRMSRAAQFAPFDALKGLTEELERRELKKLYTNKKELSEEQEIEISNQLIKLKKGMDINLTFFYKGNYIQTIDKIEKVSKAERYFVINGSRIPFDDVFEIIIIEPPKQK